MMQHGNEEFYAWTNLKDLSKTHFLRIVSTVFLQCKYDVFYPVKQFGMSSTDIFSANNLL